MSSRRTRPTPASPEPERLTQFVRERLDQIAEHLPEGRAPVADATMREVQFLRELTQLAADVRPPASTPRQSLLIPLLVAATALCISVLVFVPLRSIRVDLDVLCSGVRFRTASPIELAGVSAMSLLEANELAPVTVEDPATLETWQVDAPIELRPGEGGSLTVSSVVIPAGGAVALLATADPRTWRLEIEHGEAAVDATVRGPVQVAGSGFDRQIAFGRGSEIRLRATRAEPRRLGLFLSPDDAETLLTPGVIPVAHIAFEESVQHGSPGVAGIVRGDTSSVIEGTVVNVSLGGRELPLRKRDAVQIALARGYVRELRIERAGIRLSLTADATELLVGRAGGLQSLRPSHLEWLAQRHTLQLAWGSAIWIFGLLLGGVRWWHGTNA